jgi:hypothetical protein
MTLRMHLFIQYILQILQNDASMTRKIALTLMTMLLMEVLTASVRVQTAKADGAVRNFTLYDYFSNE